VLLEEYTRGDTAAFLWERGTKLRLLLVIQGANDPRVVEAESRDVVARLKGLGKEAEILVFPDEGHDVLKFANRVTCYNAIAGFFERHLGVQPRSE
jgi:dipeptidyl aminopeptidase/acylaminoacyl peptidase